MRGIPGELHWTARADVRTVAAMVSGVAIAARVIEAFGHRGVCALGHARLSIVDLTE